MAVFSSLDSLASLSQPNLIGVVRELVGEVARLVALSEKLTGDLVQLRADHTIVKDELARLKGLCRATGLPPRPPVKPSGMDKAADAPKPEPSAGKDKPALRRRGCLLDKLKITQTIVVKAQVP